jgi:hypothetical protein
MYEQEEVALESENDLLADAPQLLNAAPDQGVEWRAHRTQHEWARDLRREQRLAQRPWLEALDVELDIRQLGHASMVPAARARVKAGRYTAQQVARRTELGMVVRILYCTA